MTRSDDQLPRPSTHRWAFTESQLGAFPELRYVVDGLAPIEDLEAYFQAQRGAPTIVTMVIGIILAPLLVLGLHRGVGLGMLPTMAIVLAVQLVLAWWLLGIVFPRRDRVRIRAALRERLRDHGIEACASCAYDLRGSPERCPECGAPRA